LITGTKVNDMTDATAILIIIVAAVIAAIMTME
jgi:flagellar motor component MotA